MNKKERHWCEGNKQLPVRLFHNNKRVATTIGRAIIHMDVEREFSLICPSMETQIRQCTEALLTLRAITQEGIMAENYEVYASP